MYPLLVSHAKLDVGHQPVRVFGVAAQAPQGLLQRHAARLQARAERAARVELELLFVQLLRLSFF